MNKDCKKCGAKFEITKEDLEFLKRLSPSFSGKRFDFPEPTLCPDCRNQIRQAFLNQIFLFKRKCDATGESIISNFPSDSPYKVFKQEYWYSDKFEGLDYGRDFDFKREFFEQLYELNLKVPVFALFTDYLHDENSQYTNCAGKNKNCYMIFDSDEDWNCYYSYGMNGSKDSLDCYRVQSMELCYEVVDSSDCYKCRYTYNSSNCSDSFFLNNCTGCRNCIYCSNLTNKEYHVFNEPVSKKKYEEILKNFGSYKFLTDKIPQFEKFRLKFPYKYMRGVQNENVTGNHVVNSKNAFFCFDSMKLWDCRYCYQAFIYAKNCMDIHESGECELNYGTANAAYNIYACNFCFQVQNNCHNLNYCIQCISCSDCFGCVGLKRKKYCIFNKQYSKKEYEKLVVKIIEHMRKTGEWGEFLPIKYSQHAYNLTVAQEYNPLSKEEALKAGYKWRDSDKKDYLSSNFKLPDDIKDVDEAVCEELLQCAECSRNYKITLAELNLYKVLNLPLPRKCFFCRHKNRLSSRTPRHLWQRTCQKCGEKISTAYAPDRPEIVYCEKCYLKEVY